MFHLLNIFVSSFINQIIIFHCHYHNSTSPSSYCIYTRKHLKCHVYMCHVVTMDFMFFLCPEFGNITKAVLHVAIGYCTLMHGAIQTKGMLNYGHISINQAAILRNQHWAVDRLAPVKGVLKSVYC